MTLIAFHTYDDYAIVMSDTWSYGPWVRTIGRSGSKVIALPLLDAVVASQGDSAFTHLWRSSASVLADECETFDEFLELAPALIRRMWFENLSQIEARNAAAGTEFKASSSAIFHIGWSPAEERFKAVSYSSLNGFVPTPEDDMFSLPTPLAWRPSDHEMRRVLEFFHRNGEDPAVTRRNLAPLLERPDPVAPETGPDWVALGVQIRTDRGLAPVETGMKCLIGGELHFTVLTRGSITHERAFIFEDDEDLQRRLFAGTLHPICQLGPCPCGSGSTFVNCCIAKIADDPCGCGSGRRIGACCSLNADTSPATAA